MNKQMRHYIYHGFMLIFFSILAVIFMWDFRQSYGLPPFLGQGLFMCGLLAASGFYNLIIPFKQEGSAIANTPSAQKRRALGMVAMTIVLTIILALILIWK